MDHNGKSSTVHQGRNVKRLREMQGMKQQTLAYELGANWTQKKISELEAKEKIKIELLEQISKILHVSPETIEKLDESTAVNIISDNFSEHQHPPIAQKRDTLETGIQEAYNLNFNPMERVIELYERLITVEREKNELLRSRLS